MKGLLPQMDIFNFFFFKENQIWQNCAHIPADVEGWMNL